MTALGLPADLATAITVIVVGVIVPLVTAIITSPRTPAAARRWIPIALAVVGALVVVLLRGDLATVPQTLTEWVLLAAVIVGLAQTLYALMPSTWKALSAATSSTADHGRRADRDGVMDGRDTPPAPLTAEDTRAPHDPVP